MDEAPFPREELAAKVSALAARGMYIGTSSWKYEGWLNLIYSPERYMRYFQSSPSKLAKSRFQKECLAEYAQTFKTACLDAGFYQFPTPQMLDGYFAQVGDDFRLSLKVTEEITVRRWPAMERYGGRAGEMNKHFLNADMFQGSLEDLTDAISSTCNLHYGPKRGRALVDDLNRLVARRS